MPHAVPIAGTRPGADCFFGAITGRLRCATTPGNSL